jgi:hypothetical protein
MIESTGPAADVFATQSAYGQAFVMRFVDLALSSV